MDRIDHWISLFVWKNEFILLIIPIVFIIIGLLVLKQFDRNTRKMKSNFRLNQKYSRVNKVILENADHEKFLNALKEIIKTTIRSRSLIGRINTEILNLGQLVKSNIILKDQDLFILTQLNNSIGIHLLEFEKRNTDIKNLLSGKSLALALKEQEILQLAAQIVKELLQSYKEKSFLSKYSQLADRINLCNKEIVEIYQGLTDFFQEELMEEVNN
jgi:hypothetical protein